MGRAVHVVGVDGCKGGWLAVSYDLLANTLTPACHAVFADVIESYPDAACIAVDIPIGLTTANARDCDREARRVLTRLRGSSVFPAPDPRVVNAASYQEAMVLSRSLTGKGVSAQAFGIYKKVADVNRLMTPALQARIVEIHPEICFWAMAGMRPLEHAKRTPAGFEERRALLMATECFTVPTRREAQRWVRDAGADDALDAIAAAWSARRFAEGQSGCLPLNPLTDDNGLRMEMVY
jgi:predicted RNase H-like nuclease